MNPFDLTQLYGDEELVFGVATSSSSSSNRRVENGVVMEDTSTGQQRKAGVTNYRVIVESGGSASIISNSDVRCYWIKRDNFMGNTRLELEAIESNAGEKLALGIGFLEAEDEALMRSTFPNATVSTSASAAGATGHSATEKPKKKGIFGFLGFGD